MLYKEQLAILPVNKKILVQRISELEARLIEDMTSSPSAITEITVASFLDMFNFRPTGREGDLQCMFHLYPDLLRYKLLIDLSIIIEGLSDKSVDLAGLNEFFQRDAADYNKAAVPVAEKLLPSSRCVCPPTFNALEIAACILMNAQPGSEADLSGFINNMLNISLGIPIGEGLPQILPEHLPMLLQTAERLMKALINSREVERYLSYPAETVQHTAAVMPPEMSYLSAAQTLIQKMLPSLAVSMMLLAEISSELSADLKQLILEK